MKYSHSFQLVVKHPRCTYALLALVFLVLAVLLAKGVIGVLGFGAAGIQAGMYHVKA